MLPEDCVKATTDGFKLTMTNVISPLTVDEIPPNAIDYLEFKVNDAEVSAAVKKGIKITAGDKTVGLNNIQDALGVTIPVGGILSIAVPFKVTKGQKYKFTVTIKANNPINIEVERTVQ
jgi:hypothetical protein